MSWAEAVPYGIALNPTQSEWYAGHINDVLVRKAGAILVATAYSGVWLITTSLTAVPLSRDWDKPDANCLAEDVDDTDHFFAACGSRDIPSSLGALYETDRSKPTPLASRWREITLPAAVGLVYRVIVVRGPSGRFVVFTSDAGLYWSRIPAVGGTYTWKLAIGDAPAGRYYGLALGPNEIVIASAWPSVGTTDANLRGIFFGAWTSSGFSFTGPPEDDLVMARADLGNTNAAGMFCTSIASCRTDPMRVYACSSNSAVANGTLYAVLQSKDGGASWSPCSFTMNDATGLPNQTLAFACNQQGDGYNNCIGVHPTDPDTVALGWINVSLSIDGGSSWRMITATWTPGGWAARPNIHTDYHAVCFNPHDGGELYLANDGGLIMTNDAGLSFQSGYNETLRNLEFLSTTGLREFYGTFAASYADKGLMVGGTQDNGNIYVRDDGISPWQILDGGDGGQCAFLRTGDVLRFNANTLAARSAHWNAASKKLDETGVLPVLSASGSVIASSVAGAVTEIVNTPTFKNTASTPQFMYAVAAGVGSSVYGAFSNPDGSNLHWEIVGSWPPASPNARVTAIASGDGNSVYIAVYDNVTGVSSFYSLLPSVIGSAVATLLGNITTPQPCAVNRIVLGDGVFVTTNSYLPGFGNGYLLTSVDGKPPWSSPAPSLPNETFYGLETDWTAFPRTLFVATDDKVFKVASGIGWSLQDISDGLPRRSHCADLRFVMYPTGEKYLYLATFGCTLWRLAL